MRFMQCVMATLRVYMNIGVHGPCGPLLSMTGQKLMLDLKPLLLGLMRKFNASKLLEISSACCAPATKSFEEHHVAHGRHR